MLVYGDRSHALDPRDGLDALAADMAALSAMPPGLPRHAKLTGALIAAGGLAQGLADAAFMERGGLDARGLAADLAQAVTDALAAALVASWRSGFRLAPTVSMEALQSLRAVLPGDPIDIRLCEGYAFYAVYPELYAEAAAALRSSTRAAPRIVGLRSIGTSLAAAAAAGCNAAPPLTLRPCAEPFAREVRLAPSLLAELTAPSPGGWAVVDEGPGLSGSSFAAIGTLLAAHGVPATALTYLPSHGGDPGPEAPPERRAHWTSIRKLRVDFADAITPRLAAWAEPLVGPALAPLADLSGGLWRTHNAAQPHPAPAWPAQERRKFLLQTGSGTYLLKFAGLGGEGGAKLHRAQLLHRQGFASEPMGLVHGFLVERWIEGEPLDPTPAPQRSVLIEHLVRYLAFRARHLAPPHPGATPQGLRAMMARNFSLAGLHATADMAARLATPASGPPIAIDGRLHAWEWRVTPGGALLKTDALDHGQAHDLIGTQDLAWDAAGAIVEFALSPDEAECLRHSLEREAMGAAHCTLDPRQLAFATLAYLAFQIGWWRMAAQGGGGDGAAAQCACYEDLARRWRPAT